MISSVTSMQNLVGTVFICIILIVILIIVGRSVLKNLNIIKDKHDVYDDTNYDTPYDTPYDNYNEDNAPKAVHINEDDSVYTTDHIVIGPSPEQEAEDDVEDICMSCNTCPCRGCVHTDEDCLECECKNCQEHWTVDAEPENCGGCRKCSDCDECNGLNRSGDACNCKKCMCRLCTRQHCKCRCCSEERTCKNRICSPMYL